MPLEAGVQRPEPRVLGLLQNRSLDCLEKRQGEVKAPSCADEAIRDVLRVRWRIDVHRAEYGQAESGVGQTLIVPEFKVRLWKEL